LNTPGTRAYFNTLINAPKFSNDPVGHRQKKRWQLIAGDIYKSTSIEALLEARGKAEGYIHGVVDAGHLSTKDTDRDYLVLCVVQRRRDFLGYPEYLVDLWVSWGGNNSPLHRIPWLICHSGH
jgi:hypothetical protein